MDDFGLLVGEYNATLPTLVNAEKNELQLDEKGRLIISGRYFEDAAHTSGDAGIFIMAVANHTEGALHDTDGDYAALQVDSLGRLRVIADLDVKVVGNEAYNNTDNLVAAADGIIDSTITGTFTDLVAVSIGAGEIGYWYGYQADVDKNAEIRIVLDDGVPANLVVLKSRLNSSSMPGVEAHWGDGGRVEITGAAGLELKIQARKRGSGGGNASGMGSLHLRKA